jgi:hypothetical protein
MSRSRKCERPRQSSRNECWVENGFASGLRIVVSGRHGEGLSVRAIFRHGLEVLLEERPCVQFGLRQYFSDDCRL